MVFRINRSLFISCLIIFLNGIISDTAGAQTIKEVADSIRNQYHIPELAYAVVAADTLFEMEVLGLQRTHSAFKARLSDRFHIGSNTKAITSFIAATLVADGKIKWSSKIFDLFPELKTKDKKGYKNITLQDLLTFRGTLPAYSYSNVEPSKDQLRGDNAGQRYMLACYLLSQNRMKADKNGLTPSNAGYIVAGLMLEKASGKPYKELVMGLGKTLGISFGFDYPNLRDEMQPWGHDRDLKPLPPSYNYKLNWLLSAGNINVSLPDYIKFLQLQLKGLKDFNDHLGVNGHLKGDRFSMVTGYLTGGKNILPAELVNQLLFGLPVFAFGWFNDIDGLTKHHHAYNEGDAGAFITQVHVFKEANRAYVIFTNASTDSTREGLEVFLKELEEKYGR